MAVEPIRKAIVAVLTETFAAGGNETAFAYH